MYEPMLYFYKTLLKQATIIDNICLYVSVSV